MLTNKTMCAKHDYVEGKCLDCGEVCLHDDDGHEYSWEYEEQPPRFPNQPRTYFSSTAYCDNCGEELDKEPYTDEDIYGI